MELANSIKTCSMPVSIKLFKLEREEEFPSNVEIMVI